MMQRPPRTEHGYPLLFFRLSRPLRRSVLRSFAFASTALLLTLLWGSLTNDVAPDSPAGYLLAIAGTVCMLLALFRYSIQRRTARRFAGMLNAALHSHVAFGFLALFLLFLHGAGNFNARSGTYALYSLLALILSGVVGRLLDRILPRLIAEEARTTLTPQGEDRQQELLAATSSRQAGQDYQPALQAPWDLASLPLNTPLHTDTRPLSKMAQLLELHTFQHAYRKELFYSYVIRYWRLFHSALGLLTLGLTIWHILYALHLLLPH
ncbi:hypothetical protein [Thermosporothrix hazakensis]|nr:hypothetical protein [Thermosporothrix hazakensis]GCE48182.1 hypothetical protein KTH_30510 [Thermosporothrix hazakensis]